MPKIMTAHQAFNVSMNEYPSLYTDPVLEQAKLKYYDHIFNVIGNGYRDINEFIEGHTINKHNKGFIDSFPDKYISVQPLYQAYTETYENSPFPRGKSESCLMGLYTEEELKSMPQVKHTLQVNKSYRRRETFVPYPNFQKNYSIIWDNVSVLDKSWFEEAHFFYSKCKEFFASKHVHLYHSAIPSEENTEAWDKLIATYETNFARLKTENMNEQQYHQAISTAYEFEYTGNTKEFIKDRWKIEHTRINEFFDETLERLQVLMNQSTPKLKNNKM